MNECTDYIPKNAVALLNSIIEQHDFILKIVSKVKT